MSDFKPQYVDVPVGSGGPRQGAGRKHVSDKKQQHYIMVYGSVVEKLGGKTALRKILEAAVEEALQKKIQEETK